MNRYNFESFDFDVDNDAGNHVGSVDFVGAGVDIVVAAAGQTKLIRIYPQKKQKTKNTCFSDHRKRMSHTTYYYSLQMHASFFHRDVHNKRILFPTNAIYQP